MEDFQIYILQVNAGLVVFYLFFLALGTIGALGNLLSTFIVILSFISDVVFQGYFFKNPAFISFFHRYTGFCISPDFVGILVGAR